MKTDERRFIAHGIVIIVFNSEAVPTLVLDGEAFATKIHYMSLIHTQRQRAIFGMSSI